LVLIHDELEATRKGALVAYFKVLVTEEKYEKPVRIVSIRAEIETRDLPKRKECVMYNTNPISYRHV
jgi:hypothetical protein